MKEREEKWQTHMFRRCLSALINRSLRRILEEVELLGVIGLLWSVLLDSFMRNCLHSLFFQRRCDDPLPYLPLNNFDLTTPAGCKFGLIMKLSSIFPVFFINTVKARAAVFFRCACVCLMFYACKTEHLLKWNVNFITCEYLLNWEVIKRLLGMLKCDVWIMNMLNSMECCYTENAERNIVFPPWVDHGWKPV